MPGGNQNRRAEVQGHIGGEAAAAQAEAELGVCRWNTQSPEGRRATSRWVACRNAAGIGVNLESQSCSVGKGAAATPEFPGDIYCIKRPGGSIEKIIRQKRAERRQVRKFLRDISICAVSYTHLRAHETVLDLVCRLLLEKKKRKVNKKKKKKTQL